MRCKLCGKKNPRGSRYCTRCGSGLSFCCDGPSGASKRLRAVLLTALGLALLFGLAALALHFINKSRNAQQAVLPAATELPSPTPEPTPTVEPIHIVKPVYRPTPSPIPTATPRPKPPRPRKPIIRTTPVPTAEPDTTPEPTSTAAAAYDADCEPVDALCDFILFGSAQYARRAFPPEYIAYTVSNYGWAMQLLGSEDRVIEYAGGMLAAGFTAKYGTITAIEHTPMFRKVLTESELAELAKRLPDYGVNTVPTEAHRLDVELIITSSRGVFRETVSPHVILIDGAWYIDPADIDF